MYRCILWGLGIEYDKWINTIHYLELLGQIEIIGVTDRDDLYTRVDGYTYLHKDELMKYDFDLLLIMSEKHFREIQNDAINIGIKAEKIVNGRVLELPNLNIDKYMQIKKSRPTIFANNCWGGLTYHRLGLEFHSPFINMFENDEDYLKIMSAPYQYLEEELWQKGTSYNPTLGIEYPVCGLGDVTLYFNHYSNFEEAKKKWDKRKNKINWDNIIVMMYTENQVTAKKFCGLPYAKKVCFVPFETEEGALCQIDYYGKCEELNFYDVVNGMAKGVYKCYDVLDLMNGIINKIRL